MGNVWTILLAILIFDVLIIVHELGHYIFASIFKVGIIEFSIGMGPKLFGRVSKKTGIAYSVRLLPIGGYVSMVGENEDAGDAPNSFANQKAWKKIIITIAGALVNILIGFAIMFTYVLSVPVYGGTTVASFNSEDAPSYNAGLRVGDEIYSIDGNRVYTGDDVVYQISMNGYKPVDIVVERNGEQLTLEDVEFSTQENQGVTFGVLDFKIYAVEKNFVNMSKMTFSQCKASVDMVFDSITGLLSGRFGVEHMSGVVGTTQAIGNAVSHGITELLYFCAVIAVNLGIFNLLPIPALDGGHLIFHVIELFRGKPLNQKYESMIHAIGMILLLLLVAIVTVNDIARLF